MVGKVAALQDGGCAQLCAYDWRVVEAEGTLVILVIIFRLSYCNLSSDLGDSIDVLQRLPDSAMVLK